MQQSSERRLREGAQNLHITFIKQSHHLPQTCILHCYPHAKASFNKTSKEDYMEEQTIMSKSGSFVKNSASLKVCMIISIVLLLLIPVSMVKSLIRERSYRQVQVTEEIGAMWGGAQTVAGPVLTIPYTCYYVQSKENEKTSYTQYAFVLPDSLEIKGTVEPEIRYRGIFQALLYSSKLEIEGRFPDFEDELEKLGVPPEDILWEDIFLSMGISDMGGLSSQIRGKVNDNEIAMEPGIKSPNLFPKGVSAVLPLTGDDEPLSFQFFIDINGSKDLSFLPLGKETTVSLNSDWPSPSFSGQFLPSERVVEEDGFSAVWKILHLNRNYPQSWRGNQFDVNVSAFGVSLHPGTEIYQKSTRTAKYGVMFVLFTFTAFFLSEVINQLRIHPIQYLLVGCSVIIFYVLLLAFSEHIGFNLSFFLSAGAVVTLICGYTASILSRRMSTVLLAILTTLYGYLFITLQLEDYALLVGSIGLFATLSAVMYLTRKINWYSLQAKAKQAELLAEQ